MKIHKAMFLLFISERIVLIVLITARVLTPCEHTRLHFPQSMHLSSSLARLSNCPRRKRVWHNRKLKSVWFDAVQAAEQAPHMMHFIAEGTLSTNSVYREVSDRSRSMILGVDMLYPQFFILFFLNNPSPEWLQLLHPRLFPDKTTGVYRYLLKRVLLS